MEKTNIKFKELLVALDDLSESERSVEKKLIPQLEKIENVTINDWFDLKKLLTQAGFSYYYRTGVMYCLQKKFEARDTIIRQNKERISPGSGYPDFD